MATKVHRSDVAHFINTGTSQAPDWALLGEGITTGQIDYGPQTESEVYIHQKSGNTNVSSYQPTLPIEATQMTGDDALDYLDGKRISRAVLSDAETEILNVWKYKAGGPAAYPAERQKVSMAFNNFGGDAGQSNKISCTLNFLGDPTPGTFNADTLTFTPT